MKKLFLITIMLVVITNLTIAQKTVAGVTMPKKVMIGKTVLNLNGAGVREKMWIDLYACALYVKQNTKNAQDIINADEHCGIKIQIVSSLITSKKMNDAVEEGFKNATGGKTKELRKRIDSFKEIFGKEEIAKGDIYDIMYVPDRGIVVFKNGKIQPIIEGLDFKKALFSIWLGKKPADDDLKEDLLGE